MTTSLLDDLTAAIARAGVDVRLEDRSLQDAILSAISDRRGYIGEWWVDGAGWSVLLLSPVREEFRGLTLEIALAWCLIYLMSDELGIDQFAS
jgi:hypothetical protein